MHFAESDSVWLLVYGTYSLLRKNLSGPLISVWLYMYPLQGFLEFLVFMGSKVRGGTRKISRMRWKVIDLTWCQLFRKAYMASGPVRPTDRTLTSRRVSV